MRLSSPSASAFSSQASRSLELAPRVAFRGSAFAGCASAAAPTLTLMSIPVSRSVAVERSLEQADDECRSSRDDLGVLLSPFGERVGVRRLQNYRQTLTPHPTSLPIGDGADRACCSFAIKHSKATAVSKRRGK